MSKKVIFIGLVILAVIGSAVFLYYRDSDFSKEILKLEILGATTARMGDEIEYTVKYKNNGNFVLQSPKVIFELPENSLTEDGKIRFTQALEDIYPGSESFVKFKGRLLGKEGDLKVARATLSYMPKNLSARYESETTFTTKIDTVFVTLNFDLPSKIEKGKELDFSLNYFSNTDYPLESMSIRIAPINGFTVTSSDPSSLDDAEWKLETLNKSQGGRIRIKGDIGANASEPLRFTAKLGMWQNGNFITVKEANRDVEVIPSIMSPVLTLSQSIDQPVDGASMVHWQITNDVNDVKNVKVKATLPLSISLYDDINPESEVANFSWDIASRQIVWSVGDLAAGAKASLAFGVTQVPGGQIIIQAVVLGEDQFTGAVIQGSITP